MSIGVQFPNLIQCSSTSCSHISFKILTRPCISATECEIIECPLSMFQC